MMMLRWFVILQFSIHVSYAQLTLPKVAVCVGQEVVISCQRNFGSVIWAIDLPSGRISTIAVASLHLQRNITTLTFLGDPGCGFEVIILPTSNASCIRSELHVTAANKLHGVRVFCGTYNTTIQVSSVPVPSDIMTREDRSQFTLSTASITLTWSTSTVVDSYTIVVIPQSPVVESRIFSTTIERVQLRVQYNEEYSVNITAQNCAGTNSVVVPLFIVGCSSPYPLANGNISQHSSVAVGATLMFKCDTGYQPEAEVSTCLHNGSWDPVPQCKVSCGLPTPPVNGRISSNYFSTVDGSQITFHCGNDSPAMTATCSNGSWIPDPANLDCDGSVNMLSTESQVAITAVVCCLLFFIIGSIFGALCHYWTTLPHVHRSKTSSSSGPTPPAGSTPVVYEEVSLDPLAGRKGDTELTENVAYGPIRS